MTKKSSVFFLGLLLMVPAFSHAAKPASGELKQARLEDALSAVSNGSRGRRYMFGVPMLIAGVGGMIASAAVPSSGSPLALTIASAVVGLEGGLHLLLVSGAEEGTQVSGVERGELLLERLASQSATNRYILGATLTGIGAAATIIGAGGANTYGNQGLVAGLVGGGIANLLVGIAYLIFPSPAEIEFSNYSSWKSAERVSYNFNIAPTGDGLRGVLTASF
ncbi:hypothetical protein K2X33_05810 [bacterium]|nr:hypothetical protein [bacterium]